MEVDHPSTAPPLLTEAQYESLRQEWETLFAAQRELLDQHDAEGDTRLEDEPWYPQYELQEERLAAITEKIDLYEEQHRERTFLPPFENGKLCPPGQFAWDQWRQWAQADGVSIELAELGRTVIREAYQHNWPDRLKAECGWQDNGAAMLELARQQPDRALIRWNYLLASEGDFHGCD